MRLEHDGESHTLPTGCACVEKLSSPIIDSWLFNLTHPPQLLLLKKTPFPKKPVLTFDPFKWVCFASHPTALNTQARCLMKTAAHPFTSMCPYIVCSVKAEMLFVLKNTKLSLRQLPQSGSLPS